jgi:acyl carrier protein
MTDLEGVLDEEADLVEELGLASVEVMELIEELEETFDIAFPLNALADVRTIADLARQLQKLAGSS